MSCASRSTASACSRIPSPPGARRHEHPGHRPHGGRGRRARATPSSASTASAATSNVFTPQLMALGSRFRMHAARPAGFAGALRRRAGAVDRELFAESGRARGAHARRSSAPISSAIRWARIVCQHLARARAAAGASLALFGPLLAPPEPARQACATGRQGRGPRAWPPSRRPSSRRRPPPTPSNNPGGRRLDPRAADAPGRRRLCPQLRSAGRGEAADVARIACPVLLVTGDEDAVAPPRARRAMAEQINGARVVILPRCGHWATLERAAECSAALKEFYAGRARRRRHGANASEEGMPWATSLFTNVRIFDGTGEYPYHRRSRWCRATASGVSAAAAAPCRPTAIPSSTAPAPRSCRA